MTTSSSVPRPLVLASSSPRRRELLGGLGLRFTVRAAEIDETPWPAEEPASYVLRLAEEKAVAAAPKADTAGTVPAGLTRGRWDR